MNVLIAAADRLGAFFGHQPWRSYGVVLGVFVVAAAFNLGLHTALPDVPIGSPPLLGFALSRADFTPSGLLYMAAFLPILLGAASAAGVPRNLVLIWFIGLALILIGNLMQGDPDIAFRQPLLGSDFQYYHDALGIRAWPSWTAWLSDFNAKQPGLFVHSRTHPPFSVLLHYLALQLLGERPLRIGLMFTILASLAVPLFKLACDELGCRPEISSRLAILLAAIPAVNIFSAVSLDGLVLMAATAFLLGLLMLIQRPRFSWIGLLLLLAGAFLMNLLSFVGVFAFAVGLLVGGWEFFTRRSGRLLLSTALCLVLFGLCLYLLALVWNYDHPQAFFTAARIENPQGFRLLANPLDYLATRMECVAEVAFFLSIPVLAAFVPLIRRSASIERRDAGVRIGLTAVSLLAIMFLAGVNSVGETARSSMFIYPFILLFFASEECLRLKDLTILAGLQTALMQLFGFFFW